MPRGQRADADAAGHQTRRAGRAPIAAAPAPIAPARCARRASVRRLTKRQRREAHGEKRRRGSPYDGRVSRPRAAIARAARPGRHARRGAGTPSGAPGRAACARPVPVGQRPEQHRQARPRAPTAAPYDGPTTARARRRASRRRHARRAERRAVAGRHVEGARVFVVRHGRTDHHRRDGVAHLHGTGRTRPAPRQRRHGRFGHDRADAAPSARRAEKTGATRASRTPSGVGSRNEAAGAGHPRDGQRRRTAVPRQRGAVDAVDRERGNRPGRSPRARSRSARTGAALRRTVAARGAFDGGRRRRAKGCTARSSAWPRSAICSRSSASTQARVSAGVAPSC